jgi:hypothetical protein
MSKPDYAIYAPVAADANGKSFWRRIGAAWLKRDQKNNVMITGKIELLPLDKHWDGTFSVLANKEADDGEPF